MEQKNIHMVTGAFGYSGKYISKRLLEMGKTVYTLTNSPHRKNPFKGKIPAFPYNFQNPRELAESLKGVRVLYNTYWVRFNHRNFTYHEAVKNSSILFEAAKSAGVKRIVHISITNPSPDSNFEYFRGKAEVEKLLRASGISHTILRPALLFGKEDILVNNIAWALRKFPLYFIFGKGDYRLQPIYVDDLAELAVGGGAGKGNSIIDAIGPETFTYSELVKQIGIIIGNRRRVIYVPPAIGYAAARLISLFTGDVFVTRDEIGGLMAGLLHVDSPPAGKTRLTDWAESRRESLGKAYTGELSRRFNRTSEYESN